MEGPRLWCYRVLTFIGILCVPKWECGLGPKRLEWNKANVVKHI